MSNDVYVFVDNSNLWIEGKKISGKKSKPPVPSDGTYRIEYGHLLTEILFGRNLAGMPKLYGSEPPPNDSVWKIIRSKGYEVTVFKRNFYKKEKKLDTTIVRDISKLIYKNSGNPAVIALVAGDSDFVPAAESAKEEGWMFEVWYWSHAAKELRNIATKFNPLDRLLYTIGYQQ